LARLNTFRQVGAELNYSLGRSFKEDLQETDIADRHNDCNVNSRSCLYSDGRWHDGPWIVGLISPNKWLLQFTKNDKGIRQVGSRALDILKERYARDAIDKKEFQRMKADLRSYGSRREISQQQSLK